ncbi:MAG: hypothetical protein J6D16_04255 [Clostridia bacterium]|nr:hypothetical protein [Clostridia bacterium]
MKKIHLLLVALLILSALLCACTGTPEDSTAPETTLPETTAPETAEPVIEISYDDVERHPSGAHKTGTFGFTGDTLLLNLSYPSDWTLSRVGDAYEILRDEIIIGHLGADDTPDGDEWTTVAFDEFTANGISVAQSIERIGSGAGVDYRYRYDYVYWFEDEMRAATLAVALSEVDEACEQALFTSACAVPKSSSDTLGVLSDYLGDSSSILILGNSFIGTSDIGDVLREMLHINGKKCTVTAISRGYARVETYIKDSALMERIRNGAYDAVFICGFYGAAEVQNLGILKEACDKSFTELIIFPAHNESATHVATAMDTYPSLICLHWKNEVEGLIENGVDRWAMCINDSHKHSTTLAGYVGAHMIYRAIYGELPTAPMQSTISQGYVDRILGTYAYVGDIKGVPESDITYLD